MNLATPVIAIAAVVVGLNVFIFSRMFARARSGDPMLVVAQSPTPVPNSRTQPSTYRVGAWINGLNATAPLVRLTFDEHSLQIRALQTVSVAREEVTAIEPVTGMLSCGFQLMTQTGRLDRVAVWTGRRDVLADLARRGWPVVQQPPRSIVRKMFRI